MTSILYSIIAFILGLAVLIAIHEFGHFWVARLLKIKVLRFSIGFGRQLISWHDKKGTEYSISAIPLGGYVKMLDEREGKVEKHERHLAFNTRPVKHRILVVLAGPLFNMLFAVFAYWLMFVIGIVGVAPVIGPVTEDSLAYQAGLRQGMEVVAINEKSTKNWQQMGAQLIAYLGEDVSLDIQTRAFNQKDAPISDHILDLSAWDPDTSRGDVLSALGIKLYSPPVPPIVGKVLAGEPAEAAGLKPKDKILAINGKEISNWEQFVSVVQEFPEQTVSILFERGKQQRQIEVIPRVRIDNEGKAVGFLGITVNFASLPNEYIRKTQYAPHHAVWPALKRTWTYTALTLDIMRKMVIGQVSVSNISGPITIARGASASAQVGIEYYLGFLALISISLGVLNLLPIPVLDGGHLLFYLIEWIRGEPVSEAVQLVGFRIGMFLLICLMSLAFYNDIVRL